MESQPQNPEFRINPENFNPHLPGTELISESRFIPWRLSEIPLMFFVGVHIEVMFVRGSMIVPLLLTVTGYPTVVTVEGVDVTNR